MSPMRPGDYVAPGFATLELDHAFPNMIVGDTRVNDWAYLRREVPHNWYVDRRVPWMGFLNRDEVHILYNNALQYRGRRALEIGCWLGWSAAHLAVAGVELEIIDPALANPDIQQSVRQSLTSVLQTQGIAANIVLHIGASPAKVNELGAAGTRWSLVFIDGDHAGDQPLWDTLACEPFLELDGMILFHDVAAPDVGRGLNHLRDRGWNTLVYQTQQIMAAAWRGNIRPVEHTPDPAIAWTLPPHLAGYRVSGLPSSQSP